MALDTSGQIHVDDDVWIVAVRKVATQSHTGIHIDSCFQRQCKNILEKNWVEKLYGILLFKSANSLLKSNDIIQIDRDFEGARANSVRRYMERLFGIYRYGTNMNKPIIQFIPANLSKQVQDAHKKSQKIKHRALLCDDNPNITQELNHLRSYKI